MCHGMASDRRSMRPSAQQLVRRGVATFIIDMRGHGKSGGTFDGNIGRDVSAAFDALKKHEMIDSERIAFVGHSIGALASLYAASSAKGVKAVVLLSLPAEVDGLTTFWNAIRAEGERTGKDILEFPRMGSLPYTGWFNQQVSLAWMRLRGYTVRISSKPDVASWKLLDPATNIQGLNSTQKLFVQCKGDRWLPFEKTLALYEKADQPKKFMHINGGFHVSPLLPGKLRDRWMTWLTSTLK
jgi:pimeloyl-ACP methyl ester carboxylesterase